MRNSASMYWISQGNRAILAIMVCWSLASSPTMACFHLHSWARKLSSLVLSRSKKLVIFECQTVCTLGSVVEKAPVLPR